MMLWMCLREMSTIIHWLLGVLDPRNPLLSCKNSLVVIERRENWKEGGLLRIKGTQPFKLYCFFSFFPKDCKSSRCGNFVSMPISYATISLASKVWGVMGRFGWQRTAIFKAKNKSYTAFEKYQHFECFWALMTPKKNTISGVMLFNSLYLYFSSFVMIYRSYL